MLTLSLYLGLRKSMCPVHREMHLVLSASRLLFDALRSAV